MDLYYVVYLLYRTATETKELAPIKGASLRKHIEEYNVLLIMIQFQD